MTALVIWLVLGGLDSRQEWTLLIAPFAVMGVVMVVAGVAYLLYMPFHLYRMQKKLVDYFSADAVEVIPGFPFLYATGAETYLVIPRTAFKNHHSDRHIDIDVAVLIELSGARRVMLPIDPEEPEGLGANLHSYQRGGHFLREPLVVQAATRDFGYMSVHLPNYYPTLNPLPIDIREVESISLHISDSMQNLFIRDVKVWPIEEMTDRELAEHVLG